MFNCVKDEPGDTGDATYEPSLIGINDFLPETNFEDSTDDDPNSIHVTNSVCEPNEYKLKGGMKLVKRKKPKIIRSVRYHKEKDPENHFREQLVLYTPWRKKGTDLIKECQTYQEHFEQIKDEVLYKRNQYEYHSEMLDKAMDDISSTNSMICLLI